MARSVMAVGWYRPPAVLGARGGGAGGRATRKPGMVVDERSPRVASLCRIVRARDLLAPRDP
jgi:hypothetical protein